VYSFPKIEGEPPFIWTAAYITKLILTDRFQD
jgi:hypothetical protein